MMADERKEEEKEEKEEDRYEFIRVRIFFCGGSPTNQPTNQREYHDHTKKHQNPNRVLPYFECEMGIKCETVNCAWEESVPGWSCRSFLRCPSPSGEGGSKARKRSKRRRGKGYWL
ncbi:hypothetical protein M0802_006719 [Mischocyttarus mexicanus]|nr:hypothetical protein M0802_006719 [Mischocyttarus mexicanus]